MRTLSAKVEDEIPREIEAKKRRLERLNDVRADPVVLFVVVARPPLCACAALRALRLLSRVFCSRTNGCTPPPAEEI